MLAPSVVTVRRPSCEADLILARIEGSDPPLYPGLTASDSVQSEPLYDYWTPDGEDIAARAADAPSIQARQEGAIAAGGGGRSCLMTGRRQESLGALSVSPDMRLKFGHHRRASQQGGGCRDNSEVDGADGGGGKATASSAELRRSPVDSRGIRRASVTLRRSIDSLLCTLATKPRPPVAAAAERTGLSIEVVQESPIFRRRIRLKQRGKSLDKAAAAAAAAAQGGDPLADDDYDCFGPSGHLLLSLVLVSLKDGLLCAEIPINELHRIPSGHVKIKIRNYNLDVCISISSSSSTTAGVGEERGGLSQGYRGSVSLPIYVNPSTLQFRLDETRPVVHLEGKIKGCCTRIGTSLSALELSRSAAGGTVGAGGGGASVVVVATGNGSS